MRFSLVAVAVLLSLAPPIATAQIAPDAPSAGEPAHSLRELVARYREWRGGAALDQLQTIHERFYLDTPAAHGSGAMWMDRQGRMRRETVFAGARQVEVATPQGGWSAGADGKVTDDPAAAERARRYALLEFGDAFTGRGGATVELAGTADVEDKTWSVVQVRFGDADTYDALIDPASGGLCCYQITEDGVKRTELFGEWRLADGVRMPFAELRKSSDETGVKVSAIELNAPLDDALFQRPKPSAGG